MVILSEGVRIPADIRLIESFGLLVNEAPLTGESLPVQKDALSKIEKETTLAERRNCVYSGTTILAGEGKGIVMAVGSQSEFGIIAHQVQVQRKEKTPTDKAIDAALDRVNNKESYKLMQGFTEEHPWRILVYSNGGLSYFTIAGQPESLINFSTIASKDKERLLEILQKETNKGSRVVAFAFKEDTERKEISTEVDRTIKDCAGKVCRYNYLTQPGSLASFIIILCDHAL